MRRRVLMILGTAVLLCAVFLAGVLWLLRPTNGRENADPEKRREMVRIALDVGDMAPIPAGASLREVRTEGGMFTRAFRVTFRADASTVRRWLRDSPGIRGAEVDGGKYVLHPRRGYGYAEVMVDPSGEIVRIFVEWS